MSPFNIYFEPLDIGGNCPEGSSVLNCARSLGVALVNVCGGKGTCGHCLVQVRQGKVSEVSEAERKYLSPEMLSQGYRLACRAKPKEDCRVYLPPASLSSLQRAQTEGIAPATVPEPVVTTLSLAMQPPSLEDNRADLVRIGDAVARAGGAKKIGADVAVLATLDERLRESDWKVAVSLRHAELIGLHKASFSPLGIAVDIGTTKLAVYLLDLVTGKTVGARGILNPQTAYGDDIITRIAAAVHSPVDAVKLRSVLVDAINAAAAEICAASGYETGDIVEAVMVGNTAMHHLLLGFSVTALARAPYVPVITAALDVKSRELGLEFATGSYVHFLPNIAGYVGADHVAALLAAGIIDKTGVVMLLDIGTNTEICLAKGRKLTALSCASGPAFEGAHIRHGMKAADGAIERFRLNGHAIEYQTIGGTSPAGICGSGIIDIVAELYGVGIVDSGGRMKTHPNIRKNKGIAEFVVVPGDDGQTGITFTQNDIREVQLAIGAIKTGISVLLKENGIREKDIDEVIVAGAFGSYIDIDNAAAIGMLPDLPVKRFSQVGNAAGTGARMALLSKSQRRRAQAIARRIRYIELASYPDFAGIFTRSVRLGRE